MKQKSRDHRFFARGYRSFSVSALFVSFALLGLAITATTVLAGPTDEEKCKAQKMRHLGKYYLCRMKVESRIVKLGTVLEFLKCKEKLTQQFARIESKFGEFCGNMTLEEALALVGRESHDAACRIDEGGRVVRTDRAATIVHVPVEVDAEEPVLTLRNVTNIHHHARCFYVDLGTCLPGAEFDVELGPQAWTTWLPSAGNDDTIPAVPSTPFNGRLVCVQIDTSGFPLLGNSLIVTHTDPSQCAEDARGILGVVNDIGDYTLNLGVDFDGCPSGLETQITDCWDPSSATFTFNCM